MKGATPTWRDGEGAGVRRPVVVGVAGGSASGKSAVVGRLARLLGESRTAVVPHDAYYHDLSHMPREKRARVNVDHPDSLETELYVEHIEALLGGHAIDVPVYDYTEHIRLDERCRVEAAAVVIIEGILVLSDPRLRRLMDLKVYVEVPEGERLARRLRRDVEERGRTPESVREDHEWRVQPMHREFVAPSRQFADVVITGGGENVGAIEALAARILHLHPRG